MQHVEHILELPSDEFAVPQQSDPHFLFEFPRSLRVGVARAPWPIARAFEEWVDASDALPAFNWESIAAFRPNDPIVIVHTENATRAIMQLREEHVMHCPLGGRRPLVYIAFLEVAPWNEASASPRRFKGLGQLMLRFAAQRSMQLGLG